MIPFSKYSGCGNDFILIDNRCKIVNAPLAPATITHLCHRRLGIGADGIIILENSSQADCRMRIFNSDGSEAEMCGNGIRCLAKFIQECGISGNHFLIETMLQKLSVHIENGSVRVLMPPPRNFHFHLSVGIGENLFDVQFLDTGVPHAVIFVDDVNNDLVFNLAPIVRSHPLFSPQGTNVDIAQVTSSSEISMRTFERGVENETLACGTGAVAVALAAAQLLSMQSPITIHTRSKDNLLISFSKLGHAFTDVAMTGPAVKIFQGSFAL